MAGRNTAVERFLRRLRQGRLEARLRFAGASCSCTGLSGLGRSGRRRDAGSGRAASMVIHTSGHTIPAPIPVPELLALKVLVGEGGPSPELLAPRSLVQVSCCWSGSAGLYRPGNLLDSRPIWNGEFSLVGESPTIREGGYTAVHMGDMGSTASGSDWVTLAGTTGLPGTAVC